MIDINSLQKLIIEGKAEQAFRVMSIWLGDLDKENLSSFINPVFIDEIKVNINSFFINEKQFNAGIISYDTYSIQRNSTVYKLINILNLISENLSNKEGLFRNKSEYKYSEFYFPFEEIAYSLSILSGEYLNPLKFNTRLCAFANLIDTIVLSDKIYIHNACIEDDPMTTDFKSVISYYSLDDYLKFEYLSKYPSINQYKKENIQITKLIDDNRFDNIDNLTKELIHEIEDANSSFWNDTINISTKELIVEKEFEIFDYLTFLYKNLKYDSPIEEQVVNIMDLFMQNDIHGLDEESKKSLRDLILQYSFAIVNSELVATTFSSLKWNPLEFKSFLLLETPVFAPSSKILSEKVNKERYSELVMLNDYLFNNCNTFIQLPLISSYILGKSNSVKEIFEIAFDLKTSTEVKLFRNWCCELDYYLNIGKQSEAKKMIDYSEKKIKSIINKFDMPHLQSQLAFPPNYLFFNGLETEISQNLIFLKTMYNETISPTLLPNKIKNIFNKG